MLGRCALLAAHALGCDEGIADAETHAFFTRLMEEGGAMRSGWRPSPRRATPRRAL